jgi:type II secretion system protein J
MTARTRSDSGFTLVEALVSLTIFSIIAAGAVALVVQSVRGQAAITRADGDVRQLQVLQALMQDDFAQITPRRVRFPDGALAPAFIGGSGGFAFVRAAAEPGPDGYAEARLAHVSYGVRNGALVRRARAALDPATDDPGIERVLLTEARDVRFEAFDGRQWSREWAPGAGAPRAVAIVATVPRYGEVRISALVGLGP